MLELETTGTEILSARNQKTNIPHKGRVWKGALSLLSLRRPLVGLSEAELDPTALEDQECALPTGLHSSQRKAFGSPLVLCLPHFPLLRCSRTTLTYDCRRHKERMGETQPF